MRIALADLKLDELNIVYPGSRAFELMPRVKGKPSRTPVLAGEGVPS